MSAKLILLNLLLAGFFAVACIRAHAPVAPGHKMDWRDFFRLGDRVERLRRSRWQWFSMVAFLLVLRLQQPLPLAIEVMVVLQLVVFLSLPVGADAKSGTRNP